MQRRVRVEDGDQHTTETRALMVCRCGDVYQCLALEDYQGADTPPGKPSASTVIDDPLRGNGLGMHD